MKPKPPPQLTLPAATLTALQWQHSGEVALRIDLSMHNPMTQEWEPLRGHRRIVRGGTPEQIWRLVQNVGNYIDTWITKEKETKDDARKVAKSRAVNSRS